MLDHKAIVSALDVSRQEFHIGYGSGWPQTQNSPASASQILKLQECAPMPDLPLFFKMPFIKGGYSLLGLVYYLKIRASSDVFSAAAEMVPWFFFMLI